MTGMMDAFQALNTCDGDVAPLMSAIATTAGRGVRVSSGLYGAHSGEVKRTDGTPSSGLGLRRTGTGVSEASGGEPSKQLTDEQVAADDHRQLGPGRGLARKHLLQDSQQDMAERRGDEEACDDTR